MKKNVGWWDSFYPQHERLEQFDSSHGVLRRDADNHAQRLRGSIQRQESRRRGVGAITVVSQVARFGGDLLVARYFTDESSRSGGLHGFEARENTERPREPKEGNHGDCEPRMPRHLNHWYHYPQA